MIGTPQDEPSESDTTRGQARRVLILAYFFPPDTNSGVPRTVKFIKYLSRLGWQSTVIAPAWSKEARRDEDTDFAASIPTDTEVIRVGAIGDDEGIWTTLHRLPLFWWVEDAARSAFEFPDEFASWSRQVLPVARSVLAQRRHQVVYSTSPPVTSHYIALRLKKEFGLPWVADFRDPWTDNTVPYGTRQPPSWRRRLDLRLERRIYKAADCIVANTATNHAVIVDKHGVPPEKVVTITNGYDEEDFRGVKGTPPADRFRITYCGTFYLTYNPTTFLRALKKFLSREADARIVFTLAGSACDWARKNISDPDLSARLELLGWIPNRKVYDLMAASHLLLHINPQGTPYWVPGKLYEYLRSGRPIVAVCERPSEVATILERTGRGQAFRPDETEDLAQYLQSAYRNWRSQGVAPPSLAPDERILRYERAILSQRLAEAFESISYNAHLEPITAPR